MGTGEETDGHGTCTENRTSQGLRCNINMDTWREEEGRKTKYNMAKDGGSRKDTCRMEIME